MRGRVGQAAPGAKAVNLKRVAGYGDNNPLRSGWIHGEQHLFNRAAILEAQAGKGRLFLLGPEVTFRAQPHGTFKFLFNAIYWGNSEH